MEEKSKKIQEFTGTVVDVKQIGEVVRLIVEKDGIRRNFWMGGAPPDWYQPEPEDGPFPEDSDGDPLFPSPNVDGRPAPLSTHETIHSETNPQCWSCQSSLGPDETRCAVCGLRQPTPNRDLIGEVADRGGESRE
ncbi:MAG: hypothetical protein WD556_06250 [Actinomycetota bacterium]